MEKTDDYRKKKKAVEADGAAGRSCGDGGGGGLASCRGGAALPLPAPERKAAEREKNHNSVMFCCITESASRTPGQLLTSRVMYTPLGCVPFSGAQLASAHPCNYSYSICVEGIVRRSVARRNYGGNNKTAAVTTAICKLQEAANFPLRGR